MVSTRRDGTRIWYSLADDDVADLLANLRSVAHRHRPHTELARRSYLAPDDIEQVDLSDLLERAEAGDIVVLDVRPAAEYAAGHLPSAVNFPLDQLVERLDELPDDRDVVTYCRGAYCALAHEAVRLLTAHGKHAWRATDGILEWKAAGVRIEISAS